MLRTAICPGAFDPITNGHLDIIKRATALFDRVVVGVAATPIKKTYFPLEKRLKLVQIVCHDLENVTVKPFSGLLVDFARQEGATAIIRGLRAVADFDFELQMALMNKKLAGDIETVFLMAATEYSYLNSNLVRQVAMVGGCLKSLVPPVVERVLEQHYRLRYKTLNRR